MGWERRMDGESATSGARVSEELPNSFSALSGFSFSSEEPSNTSVQGPATSIMLPEEEEGRRIIVLFCVSSFIPSAL